MRIILNLNDSFDKEIVQEHKNAIFEIGYTIYKTNIINHVKNKLLLENIDHEKEFEKKLKTDIEFNTKIVEERHKILMMQKDNELMYKNMELNDIKIRFKNLEDQINNTIESKVIANTDFICQLKDKEISLLRESIKELSIQRDKTLSKTTVEKGKEGENDIIERLATCSNYTIENTTKTKEMSDIHLTNGIGETIVFEVKNKQTIAKIDIDKAYRDIDMLKTRLNLKGYVFISLYAKIPRHDDFQIESYNGIPIIWFKDVPDFNLLNIIRIIEKYNVQPNNMEIYKKQVEFVLEWIKKLKTLTRDLEQYLTEK